MYSEEYKHIYDAVIEGDWNDKINFPADRRWRRLCLPIGYVGHDVKLVASIFTSFLSRATGLHNQALLAVAAQAKVAKQARAKALPIAATIKLEKAQIKMNKEMVELLAQDIEVEVIKEIKGESVKIKTTLAEEEGILLDLETEMGVWKNRMTQLDKLLAQCQSSLKYDGIDYNANKSHH